MTAISPKQLTLYWKELFPPDQRSNFQIVVGENYEKFFIFDDFGSEEYRALCWEVVGLFQDLGEGPAELKKSSHLVRHVARSLWLLQHNPEVAIMFREVNEA